MEFARPESADAATVARELARVLAQQRAQDAKFRILLVDGKPRFEQAFEPKQRRMAIQLIADERLRGRRTLPLRSASARDIKQEREGASSNALPTSFRNRRSGFRT